MPVRVQYVVRKESVDGLTLADAIKPLSLDLFVFVHQSHRPSSLNLGPRIEDLCALQPRGCGTPDFT